MEMITKGQEKEVQPQQLEKERKSTVSPYLLCSGYSLLTIALCILVYYKFFGVNFIDLSFPKGLVAPLFAK